jgi:hypothetical protein
MNINRHNYETYFLLYVDNELSATERDAVNAFIMVNPDLREELSLLQQSIISPAAVVFDNKQALLKNGEFAQLQEKLILYLDDELPAGEVPAVESLIAADAGAREEYRVLEQTKLPPGTVVFANKPSLYRTEPKVVGIRWWRIAAAVVLLLGIGVWSGIAVYKNYFETGTGTTTIAKSDEQAKQDKSNETANANTVRTNTGLKNTNAAEEKITPVVPQQNLALHQPGEKNAQPVVKKDAANNNAQKENVVSNKPVEKPSNNLPKPYFENINNNKSNETIVSSVPNKNENNSNINSGNNGAVAQTNPAAKANNAVTGNINSGANDPKNTMAIPAVYNPDKDRYVDINDDKSKRTKVGGFLRRVKRALERTANIKTGDEIKIAGFEIAIK